jgi:acetyltransferase-like isoleucine patch superfamily enzyme
MLLTYGGNIRIGNNCSVNPFTIIYGMGGTLIGDGVRIAAHTVIVPENHNAATNQLPLYKAGSTKKGIRIDDNVWIGAGVRILDGVQIGRNTIIGAGSVVNRSLPANATAVGVPAKSHQAAGIGGNGCCAVTPAGDACRDAEIFRLVLLGLYCGARSNRQRVQLGEP